MIVFELTGTEDNEVYQELEVANGKRQYDFLHSLVAASLALGRPFISQTAIKALNFHAIACLHVSAGQFRPCEVTVGTHNPPAQYRVQALMDDFVNQVNRMWETLDPVVLASFVLWRINFIHPFINGNGRTARATCYYVLCLKVGGLIAGSIILPELLKRERDRYVLALQAVDASASAGALDLSPLHSLISELLKEQLSTAPVAPDAPSSSAGAPQ